MRFTSHTFDPNYFTAGIITWRAAFLAIYFKLVHALGGTDLFLAASCLNAFLAALCIFVTAHAGRKLGGETMGIVAGLCLLCTPPMWFSAAVFYTDFLTLLFPVLAFWLFLCGLERNVLWKSAGWYLLAGLSIGLGAMVKPTVGIVAIAATLIAFLRCKPKQAAVFALCTVLCVGMFQIVIDKAVYPAQLNRQTAQRVNTPMLHWVMMGLQGDGAGTQRTMALPKALTALWKNDSRWQPACANASGYGWCRCLALFRRKMEKCFCNGTYDLHTF